RRADDEEVSVAGFPAKTARAGTSLTTTAPAPMIEFLPIVSGFPPRARRIAPAVILAPSSIIIGPASVPAIVTPWPIFTDRPILTFGWTTVPRPRCQISMSLDI